LPHGRAADVYSLGCVFSEMITVIGLKSMDEMMDFINQDLLHKTLDLLREWLGELRPILSQGFANFIDCIICMIDESATTRPTAKEVLDFTTQPRIDMELPLCGTCCVGNNTHNEMPGQTSLQSLHTISVADLHENEGSHIPQRQLDKFTAEVPCNSGIQRIYQLENSLVHRAVQVPSFPLPRSGMNPITLTQIIDGQEYEITIKRSQTIGNRCYSSNDSGQSHSSTLPIEHRTDSREIPQPIHNKEIRGRKKGSRLSPEAISMAHQLRKETSCWRCSLQRDQVGDLTTSAISELIIQKCSPGLICNRCHKVNQIFPRSSEYVLGCDRTMLPDLKAELLPCKLH
jgi:serine/threonine protein kinase